MASTTTKNLQNIGKLHVYSFNFISYKSGRKTGPKCFVLAQNLAHIACVIYTIYIQKSINGRLLYINKRLIPVIFKSPNI